MHVVDCESPANPMSFDEVAGKFRECAEYSGWPDEKAERVVDMVRELEVLDNVRERAGTRSRQATACRRRPFKIGAWRTRMP